MSLSDPIANGLTIIRNASRVKKESADIPSSKMFKGILEILKNEGYIDNYRQIEDKKQGILRVYFKFTGNNQPEITGLRRISKPGSRIFVKGTKLPKVLNGLGVAIISTSKGVFSDKQARELKLGGEVICYIW
ncbi:MAG: 30S ribosomal protein S8 [Candidatus Omnitrophota bacterium]|nr:30S ribosomal protein S8 [Candidatus Omnitrophota bacterium]